MKYNYEFATETVEIEVNEEWEAALAEATALPKLKNHKSRTSLYIDGVMEFQVINLAYEYGDEIVGNKYAVASVIQRINSMNYMEMILKNLSRLYI